MPSTKSLKQKPAAVIEVEDSEESEMEEFDTSISLVEAEVEVPKTSAGEITDADDVSEDEEENIVIPTKTKKPAAPKADKKVLSQTEKRALLAKQTQLMKEHQTRCQESLDLYMGEIKTLYDSCVKPKAVKKTTSTKSSASVQMENVHPAFKTSFMNAYKASTIGQADLKSTLVTYVFGNQQMATSHDASVLEALNLSSKEIAILGGLEEDSPLRLTKTDLKILMAKIVKSNTEFTVGDNTYDITDAELFEKLDSNGEIVQPIDESDPEVRFMGDAVASAMKTAFGKKPAFSQKTFVKRDLSLFCRDIIKKNKSLYLTMSPKLSPLMDAFEIPYTTHGKYIYTKESLVLSRLDEMIADKTFKDPENLATAQQYFKDVEAGKITKVLILSRMKFAPTV